MISDESIKELKNILWDDYQIQLNDKDLRIFAENLKGLFSNLTKSLASKPNQISQIIKNLDSKASK